MAKQGFLFIFIFLILSLIDNGQTFIGNNIFKTKNPILFERFCVQNGEDLEEIGIANFDFKLSPSNNNLLKIGYFFSNPSEAFFTSVGK